MLLQLMIINFNEDIFKKDVSQSLHFEIRPVDISLNYLFIYKFDEAPQLSSSINKIDGWKSFCPSRKFFFLFYSKISIRFLFIINFPNDNIYKYFLDNRVVSNHQSIIFGLRQLNPKEIEDFCLNVLTKNFPIIDSLLNFTSACYYLDKNNYWKSDGLWGKYLFLFYLKNIFNLGWSSTNYNETYCFSNHLTTFSGSFIFLSSNTKSIH
jgi:hypothetical protein